MKKMLSLLLIIAMLLPSLTTVLAASVEQASVLKSEQAEPESTGIKTTAGEKRNPVFMKTKDTAAELFGFSNYFEGSVMENTYGFIRLMSNNPATVEFISDFYAYSFVAGDYASNAQSIFAIKKIDSNYILTRINPDTFEEIEIKNYGTFSFMDMAFDSASRIMYGIRDEVLYTVDLNTGDYTVVGETLITDSLFTLACSDSGILYAIDKNGVLYTLDNATGAATLVGNTGVSVNYRQAMTWDHVNGGLYWSNCNANDGILYSVDPLTAVATPLGNIYDKNMEVTCLFTKGASGDPTPVSGVNVTPEEATLKVGKTLMLAAHVLPWDATERGVSWASSNPGVATVTENGLVTAVAYGTTIITVTTTDGNFTATSTITVPDNALIDAEFDAAINIAGGTYHFVNDDVYPWDIVTLGERTAVKNTNGGIDGSIGSFTLSSVDMYRGNTISFDWFANCEANWDGVSFIVNGKNIAFFSASSTEFKNYVYSIPENGSYDFMWSYIKDSSGAAGEDLAYIDNVALDITPPGPVTGVTLMPPILNLIQTQTAQLTAAIIPGSALNIGTTFTSSDPSVATVDETGLVTALNSGTTVVTVTTHDGGFTATSTVNVKLIETLMTEINAALNVPGGELSFEMDMVRMWMPDDTVFPGRNVAHSTTSGIKSSSTSVTLNATTDGNQMIIFDWIVSSEAAYDKATFSIDGIEQALISGTTMEDFSTVILSAGTAGSHIYTWAYTKDTSGSDGQDMLWLDNIEIITAPLPQSVVIPTTAKVHLGQTIKLTADVMPEYASDTSITYSSSDTSKLIVDSSGFITGIADGTAIIRATAVNGIYAECVVTIFSTVPSPDGTLYGFVASPAGLTEGLNGMIKIDYSAGTVSPILPYSNDMYAAEYYNGVIYAYDYTTLSFLTFDAITGELLSSMPVSEIAYDMTYDYTTNTMYALFGSNERGLATVDMATGELTHIAVISDSVILLTLACDNVGKLYGIALSSGILYEVNKATAECVEIGNTTAGEVFYVQSMTYSYEADTLYWAGYTKTPTKGGFLYSVDRNTGVATTVFDAQIGEICGLMAFNNDEET
ncbi:MAG: Ig-like domain-containing protein, partial [Clostridia bacterium]